MDVDACNGLDGPVTLTAGFGHVSVFGVDNAA